ncbi:hypothetical protein EMPS_00798 [Entomortierella parvispora]|uniref:F-box domain-containing protein n=1 Tax=Entomortierella parvispora TaxID=205924 RepID=A0A9P3LS71_9FUNG|nr:hypothetical protein EMPS_00798 [Entomortierella parvispora]
MENLPPELFLVIVSDLDRKALLSANRACKAWNNLLSPVLWNEVALLRRNKYRHAFKDKAFWEGVRKYGSFIRKLSVQSFDALEPFLQEGKEEEDRGRKEVEEEREGEEDAPRRPGRPYVRHLVELNFSSPMLSRVLLEVYPQGGRGDNLAWFKPLPPRLLLMMKNNPGLEIFNCVNWPITSEWYYKRHFLSSLIAHDLGHALKTLKITVDLIKNDRNNPLFWLLRNLPHVLQELFMTIKSGTSCDIMDGTSGLEFQEIEARSLTFDEAMTEMERYDNERDRQMDLDEEEDATRPMLPLSLKALGLSGCYPLPRPGLDGCSIGSTFVVNDAGTQLVRPAYFLQELERLIQRCRPTLESLTMDMDLEGCLFVTGVQPTEWFGVKELAQLLDRSQGTGPRAGSALQSLSNFTTSKVWDDEDLAELLSLTSSSDDLHSTESWVHPSFSSPSGWRNLTLTRIEDSYVRTSAAILKHVSTLESLTLKLSDGFPSRDLARIFRTSPRLKCLLGIEDNNDPIQEFDDPYLNVALDAQDLLLPLHEIDRFWSTWTEKAAVHPGNRGWIFLNENNYDNSERQCVDLNSWACHDSLEVLQIMIKNVPRPDLTRSQYGGQLSRLRNGTLAHEEYKEPYVAVQVEREICRRLGKMKRLKKLILGIDDRKWKDLSFYRDIPEDRLRDLGIDWPVKAGEANDDNEYGSVNRESEDVSGKGEKNEDGDEERPEEYDEEDDDDSDSEYSDNDFYWEEGLPNDLPLMFHDTGYQYSCLSLSLDAGLEHLAGLKDLEVLGIERMSHRVRLREVQWMVANWPKLRRIEGLAHMGDARCKVPGETEEAVQWLQEHCPWIELGWSPDNMRQGSWTSKDYHMIWY